MEQRVRFYYDIVCPYSYMESRAAEQAEDGGLSLEWLPLELRPAPRPLLDPRGDHLRTDWTQVVYRRALERGIEIHLPRYQPRSTLPLAACVWADEQGQLREFRRALYECFFCEGNDVASEEEIARAASRAGLDSNSALEAAHSPERIGRLQEIRKQAQASGVWGVPSVLTADGQTHWGMGGIDRVLAGEPLVPRAAVPS
jgi:2-hydroxychromene-2-carboxylate isomerase